jgi:hypothetical protein
MTLIKSLLLGSAATLVVVAGAQAADLPTRKGAPVAEYVRVCKIDGMAGFVIPGSDTCLKITGYMTGQVTAGTLDTGYAWAGGHGVHAGSNETVLKTIPTTYRPDIGYTTRAELEFITKTNTAYGVLTSDIDTQFNYGSGFDNTGAGVGFINHGFVNWAGITAGKANSFFSAFGGGEGWANLFSPDQMGYNQPFLLAYTATFGGGFSATISLQDPIVGGGSGPGVDTAIAQNSNYQGLRSPDIVAAIDLVQGWGTAHLAGVAHNVNMDDSAWVGTGAYDSLNTWGWAIDGGLKFNLPTIGAGDEISLQGAWSQNAMWYSGIVGGMWDEAWGFGATGGVNGNGVGMPVADAYSNHNGTWATPTAWTIAASGEFHLGPTWMIAPEIGYGEIHWSGLTTGVLSANTESWMGGAVFHWDPVAHLDFALELLYQSTNMSRPAAWTGDIINSSGVTTTGNAWKSTSEGLEGRLMISRDF